jgi:hypothetical protein
MLKEEWDAITMETINGLFRTVRDRFRMCVAEDGRSIWHLVRNMAHANEHKPVPHPPRGLISVREIGPKHIGMTIHVRARVTSADHDQQNPDLFWVQLEDLPEFTREGDTPRKIRMMTGDDEIGLVPTGSDTVVIADVLGANGQFTAGAPDDIRRSLKLNIYLRFLAIADRVSVREVFEEDGSDDDNTTSLPPDGDESQELWDRGSEFPPPPMLGSSGEENLSGDGEREDRFDLPSDADESQRPRGRRPVVPDNEADIRRSTSDEEEVRFEEIDGPSEMIDIPRRPALLPSDDSDEE